MLVPRGTFCSELFEASKLPSMMVPFGSDLIAVLAIFKFPFDREVFRQGSVGLAAQIKVTVIVEMVEHHVEIQSHRMCATRDERQ